MSAANSGEAEGDTDRDGPPGNGAGGGWLAAAAAVAVMCCAGPAVLAGLGAGALAGALGAWLRLGAIAVALLAVLAGAATVLVRRRRR